MTRLAPLECVLEDLYPDGIEETTLNDLLWFEEESLYEWVGLHYGVNSGIVSDEPLCPACDDHIPEYECDNCLDTVCEHCMVKCVKCNKVICKDCNNGEKEKPLCSDCYDDKENQSRRRAAYYKGNLMDEEKQVVKKITMLITADADFDEIDGETSYNDAGDITIYPKNSTALFLDFSIESIEDYTEED